MSRHPIDRPRAADDGLRAEHYADIERQKGDEALHPKVQAVAKRSAPKAEGTRVKEFARIERGKTA